MFEMEYIIIREEGAKLSGAPVLSSSSGTGPGLSVQAAVLTEAERSDLVRDPASKAVVAAMPLKLIEPFARSAGDREAGAVWGLDAVHARATTLDGSGITVAVLDTGIDSTHAAFQGVPIETRNFTTEQDHDIDGHGTHCAGTIFGKDVDGKRIGIARNVEKALVGKVLGDGGGKSTQILEAVQWATQAGAQVISMSLGIDFPGFVNSLVKHGMPIEAATSRALRDYRGTLQIFDQLSSITDAYLEGGAMIVAASGNFSKRPDYSLTAEPPSAASHILAVGAVERTNDGVKLASFSNGGVDVCAPGVDVVSAKAGGGLVSMDGTSMATPHVAGVAALWAQMMQAKNRAVTADQIRAQLIARADTAPIAAGTAAPDMGAGIVQAPTEGIEPP